MFKGIQRHRDTKGKRCFPFLPHVLVLAVTPWLAGCLPGMGSDDDNSGPASFAGSSAQNGAPTVNRGIKASFLSLPFGGGSSSPSSSATPEDPRPSLQTASFSAPSQPAFQTTTVDTPPAAREPAILPPSQSLHTFYDALSALASGKRQTPVTIIHIGDGNIADDSFTGEMREHLQSRFGNAGQGMMMPGLFPIRGMRVDRGGHWTLSSSAAGAPGLYSLTGVRISTASPDAWVRFSSQQSSFEWAEMSFATGPNQGTAVVTVDGSSKSVPTRAANLDQTNIRITAKAREILIHPAGDGEIALTSVATGTNGPGVRYISLGLPGASAFTPGKWNASVVANDLQRYHPDLIVFSYGTQEGSQDGLDMRHYEAQLHGLVSQFKQLAPQSSLLVIAPPDAARMPAFAASTGSQVCRALNGQELASYEKLMARSDERLARWHSPPKLESVRQSLRRVAVANGAYYWDWFKFMGGPCSVHAWSTAKPPLAALDHVTLTAAGEERSGRALFSDLMAGYDAYVRDQQAKARAAVAAAQPAPAAKKPVAKAVRKVN